MERKYGSQTEAMDVAKEAMWLAYQASRPMGLGFLQEKSGLAKEDIVRETKVGDHSLSADYCFGRMMKTHFSVNDGMLTCNDTPHGDYQSWARRYPTYAALIDAAEQTALKESQSTSA